MNPITNEELSLAFKNLVNCLMEATKCEMSLQAEFDYDIYDAHTGLEIALSKLVESSSDESYFLKAFDTKYEFGTQVRYKIKNEIFLIYSIYYWDTASDRWKEDMPPFESTYRIWGLLQNG